MHLKIATSIFALSLGIFASSAANAADAYNPGRDSMKDGTDAPYQEPRDNNHSGFYIKGDLGIANGDRSVSRTINRDIGLHGTVKDYDSPADGTDDEKATASATLDYYNIPHSYDGNQLLIPLIADRLGFGGDDDFSSTVFGGEVSYLYRLPNSRVGFEVGLGVTSYGDAETGGTHKGAAGEYVGGTALADATTGGSGGTPICGSMGTCAGDTSHFTQSGFTAVDRDIDIDLIARVYYFVAQDIALNVGGGVSWARANISGASGNDIGNYDGLNTSINEDVNSIGYVLTAGATWWATDRITIGIAYDYKNHNFDASGSASDTKGTTALGLHGSAHDSIEVEDDVHTIKGKIGFKLN